MCFFICVLLCLYMHIQTKQKQKSSSLMFSDLLFFFLLASFSSLLLLFFVSFSSSSSSPLGLLIFPAIIEILITTRKKRMQVEHEEWFLTRRHTCYFLQWATIEWMATIWINNGQEICVNIFGAGL